MKKILTLALMLMTVCGAMAQEGTKKYDIKSGMLKTTTEVMGQVTETVLYFDNYGAQEVTKVKMDVPGMGEMEISTIVKDGKTWVVNHTMKQVQEVPDQGMTDLNFTALTEEAIAEYKVKEAGKETVLGKECTKYTYEVVAQGQKASMTSWVYKGLPLKSVTALAGMEITMEAAEFLENIMVLPQTFEVPTF